jgi:XTP/dITP diphosphohydrolase
VSTPLEQAVQVMDRLRSPGGCPWDAAQTHESLTRYLLEEAYEVIEAIETGDVALLREELGDLLLQVLFHARLAEELPAAQAFGVEDVAGDLVAKLVRRHPHVFAGAQVASAEELNETWERQKVAEKGRTSAVDGVPLDQPALALTGKLISRTRRAGLDVPVPAGEGDAAADEIGRRLFATVAEAVERGVDAEAALRRTARAYRTAVRAREAEQAGEAAAEPAGKRTAERKGPSQ